MTTTITMMGKMIPITDLNYKRKDFVDDDDLVDGADDCCGYTHDSCHEDEDEDEIEENTNPLIEVDGFTLKISDPQSYASFLIFQYYCRLLCGLESSRVPWDAGEELDPRDEFYHDLAITAIEKYNQHCKKPKLKFVELVKANICNGASTYNLTFLAANRENGIIGTYQAALLQSDGEYILGLFVDQNANELLAIVSLTGAAATADMRNLRKMLGDEKGGKGE